MAKREPIALPGTARNHEGRRNFIIQQLRSARHEARLTVRKTDRLLRFFETDMATLNSRKPEALRDALYHAAHSGAAFAVARLLGAPNNTDAFGLYDFMRRSQPATATTTEPVKAAAAATVVDVVTEAAKIATRARDDSIEIDWSDDPSSEREAELRAAIIRQVEAEYGKFSPGSVRFQLRELGKDEDGRLLPEIGNDLYDAIELWGKRCKDYLNESRREDLRKLRNSALDQLNGNAS